LISQFKLFQVLEFYYFTRLLKFRLLLLIFI